MSDVTIIVSTKNVTKLTPSLYQTSVPDNQPENPRLGGSGNTTIQTWGEGASLSDKNQYQSPGEFILGLMLDPYDEFLLANITPDVDSWEKVPKDMRNQIARIGGYPGAIRNIRLRHYDLPANMKSDRENPTVELTIEDFSEHLQNEQVGWIYVTPEHMEINNMNRERAVSIMRMELQDMQDWTNGDSTVTILLRKGGPKN